MRLNLSSISREFSKKENKIELSFLDIATALLICISGLAVATLALGLFNPKFVVVGTLLLFCSVAYLAGDRLRVAPFEWKSFWLVLTLLLTGFMFRAEPFHYVAGGQDQGVYVSMSKHFERTGEVFYTDQVRARLPEQLKEAYDSQNYEIQSKPWWVEGKKEGYFWPGLYLKDQNKSQHVFQFYHLHPLWMGIFGGIFGNDYRFYSLTLFSLFSIFVFYALARELSGSKALGFVAGAILAINPLHVFFSKWPVAEVVALTFSLTSLYYLLRFYKSSRSNDYRPVFLMVSALAMGCMFFTRITGFMYLPFFYLLLISVELYARDNLLRIQFRWYVAGVFLLYGLSVLYGLTYSYPYATDIYRISFARALGEFGELKLVLLGLILTLLYLQLAFIGRKPIMNSARLWILKLQQYIPYFFIFFLLVGSYRVYQLGFTDSLLDQYRYSRWGGIGTGIQVIFHWSPVVLVQYLSPFISLLFFYVLFASKGRLPPEKTMLLLLLLSFFAYLCVLQWFIAYQYYYARYLLTEALPFTLLFSITGVARLTRFKKIAYIAIASAAFYMLVFTSIQMRTQDLEGFEKSLMELEKYVGAKDVLILEKRSPSIGGHKLRSTLSAYLGYDVLTVDEESLRQFSAFFCSKNRNVFWLGKAMDSDIFLPVSSIPVAFEISEHSRHIPLTSSIMSGGLKLGKLPCDTYLDDYMRKAGILYLPENRLGQVRGIQADGVWTEGTVEFSNLSFDSLGRSTLAIQTRGYRPLASMVTMQPHITVNGITARLINLNQTNLQFELPKTEQVNTLTISLHTFRPIDFKIGKDRRQLGLDIKSIELLEEPTTVD